MASSAATPCRVAANPLLLTAMCIVFDEGKRLPQDRHELYERVVATVLYGRYRDPADIDRARRELGVIAYGMHTGAGFADRRATPRAEATFHEVERWLRDYHEARDYTERAESGMGESGAWTRRPHLSLGPRVRRLEGQWSRNRS